MTLGGWITFLLSSISVTSLFIWCLYKVLTAKPQQDENISGAFDIFEKE